METIEIIFNLEELPQTIIELIPFKLESLGFTGFHERHPILAAYIPADNYDRDELNNVLTELKIPLETVRQEILSDRNWNELWEKNFAPVKIGKCLIRAPFHQKTSENEIEIIIEPKMSFGTGHHATTHLMISELFKINLQSKTVFDAGCGTGILSILSEKLGAGKITAVDIDEWSIRNSQENIIRNNCSKITVLPGELNQVNGLYFDVVLANINLNIHMENLQLYNSVCKTGGTLLLSGILSSDIQSLNNETKKLGFSFYSSEARDNWALVRYTKN